VGGVSTLGGEPKPSTAVSRGPAATMRLGWRSREQHQACAWALKGKGRWAGPIWWWPGTVVVGRAQQQAFPIFQNNLQTIKL
jgi:hypothetical protein